VIRLREKTKTTNTAITIPIPTNTFTQSGRLVIYLNMKLHQFRGAIYKNWMAKWQLAISNRQ
jgi:hypothetical protein